MNSPEWLDYLHQFDLPAGHFQNIPLLTNKHCVIIEPREHELLAPVIKNFMYLLQNKGWGLVVIHGTQNCDFIKEKLSGWQNVRYIQLNIDNLTMDEYNHIMTIPTIWERLTDLGCKHALMFQTDVLLLKDNADDFLKYDYIGAPWCQVMNGLELGFNGGFSLRNVSKMTAISTTCQSLVYPITGIDAINKQIVVQKKINEDVYYSYWATSGKIPISIPSKEAAKCFSVETIYHEDPLGMHQPHIGKFPSRQHFVDLVSKRYVLP
jgi:hypothetical protein